MMQVRAGVGAAMLIALALGGWAGAQATGAGAPSVQGEAAPPAGSQPPRGAVVLDGALLAKFGGDKAVSRPSQDAIMGFNLPSGVSGTSVVEILKRGGTGVRSGDVIVRANDAEEAALLAIQKERISKPWPIDRAKAQMDLADVEYKRIRDIFDRGASGTQELERARLTWEVSKIDFELARSQDVQEKLQVTRIQARVEGFRIVAPFDGVVDTVNADVGQAVSGSEKIVRVVDVDPLWIDVPAGIDDEAALGLAPGHRAWVLVDVAGKARMAMGTVIEVAPTADPASRTRRVRVEVPNPPDARGQHALLAGQGVWVRFSAPPEGMAHVPMVSGEGAERRAER